MSPAMRAAATEERRQRRVDARGAIMRAARELLEERPWHELPVDELTRAAGLSRTVFYRHFDDRQALLLALLDEAAGDLAAAGARWHHRGNDPGPAVGVADEVASAARALVEVFRVHGRMLQAFADAAAEDPEVRTAYETLGEDLAAAVADRFRRDAAHGVGDVAHPADVARALVWMNERYLLAVFGRPARAAVADPDAAVAALTEIWTAVSYGQRVRSAPPSRTGG